jgi:hypothetical protein
MSKYYDRKLIRAARIAEKGEPLSSHAVLCDVDRNSATCVVSWCGNKCDLYQKDMSSKVSYIVIQSLESNGHCPYRKGAVYVF